MYLVVYNGTLT